MQPMASILTKTLLWINKGWTTGSLIKEKVALPRPRTINECRRRKRSNIESVCILGALVLSTKNNKEYLEAQEFLRKRLASNERLDAFNDRSTMKDVQIFLLEAIQQCQK